MKYTDLVKHCPGCCQPLWVEDMTVHECERTARLLQRLLDEGCPPTVAFEIVRDGESDAASL